MRGCVALSHPFIDTVLSYRRKLVRTYPYLLAAKFLLRREQFHRIDADSTRASLSTGYHG